MDSASVSSSNEVLPIPMATSTKLQPIDGPENITSIDCKILQYQYGIIKLKSVMSRLKKLYISCSPKKTDSESVDNSNSVKVFNDLPLLHYIVLLTGNYFAINESAFASRLELLSNFKAFKPTQFTISSATSHIPYDHLDTQTNALLEMPSLLSALKCLKVLEALCAHCLQGYQKRLDQTKIDREKFGRVPTNYYEITESLISKDLFKLDSDIDLTLDELSFQIPQDESLLNNGDFIEATLVDMDIKMLFLINKQTQKILDSLKPQIIKMKSKNPPSSESFKYSLHKIFLLTLRLNDIYTMLRKFGRKIYLSNLEHLNDQKFLFQSKNPAYFKSVLLNNLEDLFNSTKKNGTLIANLTRFIRQNSIFEVNQKNINEFTKYLSQSFSLMETIIERFDEFGCNWIACELRFRKVYQLPKKNLYDIYQSIQEKKLPAPVVALISNGTKITPPKWETFPSRGPMSLEKELKKLDLSDTVVNRSSRSSSVSSVNSNGSVSSSTRGIVRRGSLNSPNRSSVLISSNSITSPSRPRPTSMLFMNQNSSLSKIDTLALPTSTESALATVNTTPSGRRRSNSQPIKPSPTAYNTEIAAASGAAHALNSKPSPSLRSPSGSLRSPSGSLRSPSGSIKSNLSTGRKPASPANSQASQVPQANKVQKQLLAVAEEGGANTTFITTKSKQLSANQRLQQHLRLAAKSGALMTQEKEVFTSVTFDPNKPSAFNLRSYADAPAASEAAAASALSSNSSSTPKETKETKETPQIVAPVPRVRSTRDQVTRRNTQRNSATSQVTTPVSTESLASYSSVSFTSSENSSGLKKVRFTGVADYSEAEDAPTNFSNRILKNFAVFKTPTFNAQFKKKDQLLKKEESLSFKHQLHGTDPTEVSPVPPPSLVPKSLSTNRLSKIKNRLI